MHLIKGLFSHVFSKTNNGVTPNTDCPEQTTENTTSDDKFKYEEKPEGDEPTQSNYLDPETLATDIFTSDEDLALNIDDTTSDEMSKDAENTQEPLEKEEKRDDPTQLNNLDPEALATDIFTSDEDLLINLDDFEVYLNSFDDNNNKQGEKQDLHEEFQSLHDLNDLVENFDYTVDETKSNSKQNDAQDEVINLDDFEELLAELEDSKDDNTAIALKKRNADMDKNKLSELRLFRKSKSKTVNSGNTEKLRLDFGKVSFINEQTEFTLEPEEYESLMNNLRFSEENSKNQDENSNNGDSLSKDVMTVTSLELNISPNSHKSLDTQQKLVNLILNINNKDEFTKQNVPVEITLSDVSKDSEEKEVPLEVAPSVERITQLNLLTEAVAITSINPEEKVTVSDENAKDSRADKPNDEVKETVETRKALESDDDYCEGYHSSDFEFITQSDAEKAGIIDNRPKLQTYKHPTANKELKTLQNGNRSKRINNSKRKPRRKYTRWTKRRRNTNFKAKKSFDTTDSETSEEGELKSLYSDDDNENISPETSKDSEVQIAQNNIENVVNIRNDPIPQGDAYLNLFQGLYAPTNLGFLENKSVRTQTCMNIQYEGIGFDMRLNRHDDDDEYKQEAEESVQKILQLYPDENRSKRKRRRRF